jgi:FkbM family methyltransferase
MRWGSSDLNVFRQVFLDRDYELPPGLIDETIEPPALIVDAGANIGLSALFFAKTFPGVDILAIEPDAANFALLVQNVADCPKITPVRAALWWRHESLEVRDRGTGFWGLHVAPTASQASAIPVVTMDDVINDHAPDGCVSLLKLDIEGAESEVLQNADGWISSVRGIVAELHETMKPGVASIFESATRDFPLAVTRGELSWAFRH